MLSIYISAHSTNIVAIIRTQRANGVDKVELTEQEKRLIAAYRQADNRAQHDARRILESHKSQVTTVSKILSIADFVNNTVKEV